MKTFKEYSAFMKMGQSCIKAVVSHGNNFIALVCALSEYDFFVKHPRIAYREYLKKQSCPGSKRV